MANVAIAFLLVFIGTLCIFQESISIPQNSIPINTSGGGATVQPYGELDNRTSSVPGSGYPGEYYAGHSNETAPTSPTMNAGSVDVQNSSLPTSTCDSGQMDNLSQTAGGSPAEASGASGVPGTDSAGAAGSGASRK